jgi:hypothetical protein
MLVVSCVVYTSVCASVSWWRHAGRVVCGVHKCACAFKWKKLPRTSEFKSCSVLICQAIIMRCTNGGESLLGPSVVHRGVIALPAYFAPK